MQHLLIEIRFRMVFLVCFATLSLLTVSGVAHVDRVSTTQQWIIDLELNQFRRTDFPI